MAIRRPRARATGAFRAIIGIATIAALTRPIGVEYQNCRAFAVNWNERSAQVLAFCGQGSPLPARFALAHGPRWNGNSAGATSFFEQTQRERAEIEAISAEL